jgi:hypothetical protein
MESVIISGNSKDINLLVSIAEKMTLTVEHPADDPEKRNEGNSEQVDTDNLQVKHTTH